MIRNKSTEQYVKTLLPRRNMQSYIYYNKYYLAPQSLIMKVLLMFGYL